MNENGKITQNFYCPGWGRGRVRLLECEEPNGPRGVQLFYGDYLELADVELKPGGYWNPETPVADNGGVDIQRGDSGDPFLLQLKFRDLGSAEVPWTCSLFGEKPAQFTGEVHREASYQRDTGFSFFFSHKGSPQRKLTFYPHPDSTDTPPGRKVVLFDANPCSGDGLTYDICEGEEAWGDVRLRPCDAQTDHILTLSIDGQEGEIKIRRFSTGQKTWSVLSRLDVEGPFEVFDPLAMSESVQPAA